MHAMLLNFLICLCACDLKTTRHPDYRRASTHAAKARMPPFKAQEALHATLAAAKCGTNSQ
jgi:hypothetical protein